MLASDYISDVRQLVHDVQSTDWTDAELLNWVNDARERVALDAHCVRSFYTSGNVITQQEIYPMTGGVMGLILVNGGTNYTAPTVTIAAPGGGGTTATATATVTSGVITALAMTSWGTGYTSLTPTVTITDSTGAGASATPVVMVDVLDILSCTLLYPGNAQGQMLAWFPFTIFQAWLRFNRQQYGFCAAWTTHRETNQLFFGRPPDQPYTLEIDAATLPFDLPLVSSTDTQIIQPYADSVKFYAAYLAMMKLQNYEHAQTFEKIYERRIQKIIDTKQDRRIPNVYQNTYRRMMRGW